MRETTLVDIADGASARVTRLTAQKEMRARLQDLGLTRGARVRCLFAAPAGDPRAYLVRGAVVALRGVDARQIGVEAIG